MDVFRMMGNFTREAVLIRNFRQPNEQRVPVKGIVQGTQGVFPVSTPIYEGDVIELPDPRGGVRRMVVASVRIHEGMGLDNIEVRFGGSPV